MLSLMLSVFQELKQIYRIKPVSSMLGSPPFIFCRDIFFTFIIKTNLKNIQHRKSCYHKLEFLQKNPNSESSHGNLILRIKIFL